MVINNRTDLIKKFFKDHFLRIEHNVGNHNALEIKLVDTRDNASFTFKGLMTIPTDYIDQIFDKVPIGLSFKSIFAGERLHIKDLNDLLFLDQKITPSPLFIKRFNYIIVTNPFDLETITIKVKFDTFEVAGDKYDHALKLSLGSVSGLLELTCWVDNYEIFTPLNVDIVE